MSTVVRRLRDTPAKAAMFSLSIAIFSAGVTPIARAIAESLSVAPSSPDHQRVGLRLAQQMAVALEHWNDAIQYGATLASLDSTSAAEALGDIAVALDAKIPPSHWRNAGDVLERASRTDSPFVGWRHRTTSTLLAARAADEQAYTRRLRLLEGRARAPARFIDEVHVARALHADAAGDTLSAWRELGAIGLAIESTLGRWLRGRSLERTGKSASAARWYLSTPWGPDGILLTRSSLMHAAALAAARGDQRNATDLSRRAELFAGR